MAEVPIESQGLNIGDIVSQITPLMTSMMSLMITFEMLKMVMGMFREW